MDSPDALSRINALGRRIAAVLEHGAITDEERVKARDYFSRHDVSIEDLELATKRLEEQLATRSAA